MTKLKYLILPLIACSGTAYAQDVVEAPAANPGTEIEIATGADYSIGDYGALDDTSVWSVPLDLKITSGGFRASAGISWVRIKGPGQIVGGVIVSAPGGVVTSRSGLGDLNLSAAYALTKDEGVTPMIELSGSVKVPTAKGTIGTGEMDYSVTASVYKTVVPKVMLFGSVGYSWLGSPAQYQLENGIAASGGLNFRPDDNQNYGVSAAWREPVAVGLDGQAVVSPYMTYRVSPRFGLTLYGMAGLNDASPRVGGGLRLSVFP
jgi:Putative MetA-pathway of phenol degradation